MGLVSFNTLIGDLAKERPDQVAVICNTETITYQQLDRASNRLARFYQAKGVKHNDYVTLALGNGIEIFVVCLALWKCGAIPQPVSYRLPQKELQAIVQLATSGLVIGVDPVLLPGYQVMPAGFTPDASLSDNPLPDSVARHWKAPTSGGSTGRPKLIVSGEPAMLDITLDSLVRIPRDEVSLIPGPIYHNGPFIAAMHSLLRGNQVIVMTKFDAEECLQLIERYRVTWTVMVPTMMQRIWRLPKKVRDQYGVSSLKTLWHMAAPCAPWLKEAFIDWLGGDVIFELYGGAEGHGTTVITGTDWMEHKGSVGKVQPGCQVKIVNEQGETVPTGQTGEIYFLPDTGQGSTYHYIGAEPDAIEGGWETLGDMGYFDEEGYLYLCDRKKDMILSGGANVYPAEVKGAIESHPNVRSAIVVGLPDEDLGQRVHALVDAPKGLTQDELCHFLSEELVRYKIPRSFEFVNDPLRDDAGKARRSQIATDLLGQQADGRTSQ